MYSRSVLGFWLELGTVHPLDSVGDVRVAVLDAVQAAALLAQGLHRVGAFLTGPATLGLLIRLDQLPDCGCAVAVTATVAHGPRSDPVLILGVDEVLDDTNRIVLGARRRFLRKRHGPAPPLPSATPSGRTRPL